MIPALGSRCSNSFQPAAAEYFPFSVIVFALVERKNNNNKKIITAWRQRGL
jgi:hypothetical protein